MSDTASRSFSITREISRRELERHQKRFVGITASAPVHIDVSGLLEWQVDVRVGSDATWGLIKGVTIAQWALGIVADMNIPVLCERSEAGRVTIIARSEVRLPDIVYSVYTPQDLGLVFQTGLEDDGTGVYRDGYGYAMPDPTGETGISRTYTWTLFQVGWDSSDFEYGETELDGVDVEWT